MKFIIVGLFGLLLAGCTAAAALKAAPPQKNPGAPTSPPKTEMPAAPSLQPTPAVDLPVMGPAPELTNEVWLNTDHPLRLANLRGKVVLLEMWTFDCINCQHVIPSLLAWHQKYSDQGLVLIGNHYPEFASERSLNNLKDAVKRLNIPYAVAQDNDGRTWEAYHNSYWPTLYLIDKQGNIRYIHIGEGAYDETETAIQTLLAEGS
jgi:thiol-disulfide isomerase/thioredoxin